MAFNRSLRVMVKLALCFLQDLKGHERNRKKRSCIEEQLYPWIINHEIDHRNGKKAYPIPNYNCLNTKQLKKASKMVILIQSNKPLLRQNILAGSHTMKILILAGNPFDF